MVPWSLPEWKQPPPPQSLSSLSDRLYETGSGYLFAPTVSTVPSPVPIWQNNNFFNTAVYYRPGETGKYGGPPVPVYQDQTVLLQPSQLPLVGSVEGGGVYYNGVYCEGSGWLINIPRK